MWCPHVNDYHSTPKSNAGTRKGTVLQSFEHQPPVGNGTMRSRVSRPGTPTYLMCCHACLIP